MLLRGQVWVSGFPAAVGAVPSPGSALLQLCVQQEAAGYVEKSQAAGKVILRSFMMKLVQATSGRIHTGAPALQKLHLKKVLL